MFKSNLQPNLMELLRFTTVGVISTLINLTTYYILINLNINTSIAYSLGYGISLIFNYILTLNFTFKTKHNNTKGAKFLLTHLFNYLLQLFILNIFLFIVSKNIAPILTQAISMPINFFLVRKVVK